MHHTGITVILSTFNRARDLCTTLESFCALDREGLDVEFVVVDNNSNDTTPAVIESFRDRIPLRGIFHAEPGKNRALNRAIEEVELRDIVVFTDDDVTPRRDWLQQIAQASEERPGFQVFGGKIEVVWPDGVPPRWCTASWVHVFAFGLHDLAERPREYSSGSYPFGGNFWVRALVFSGGLRYSEHIGPAPQKRLMGSETTFLRSLEKAGHRMFYVPDAVVGHRIQSQELNKKMIIRRAVRLGRSNPHVYGLPDADLLKRSRTRWLTKRLHQIARACLVEARAVVTTRESKRFERRCAARRAIALQLEAIRLSLDEQKAVRYVCISTRVAPP